MKKISLFLIILLSATCWDISAQTSPSLIVNLAGSTEMRGAVENMTDNILVNIVNTSNRDVEAYFVLTLTGNTSAGAVAVNNINRAHTHVIDIQPGGRSYSISQLIEEFQNASLQDFEISPASLVNQIMLTRNLPAGNYNICIEARDPITKQLISTAGSNNCLRFAVAYRMPPVIQTPLHDAWVATNDANSINISWMVSNFAFATDRFTIDIVRFRSQQEAGDFVSHGSPQSQFPQRFEPILHEEDIIGLSFNTLNSGMMPELNPGDILGIRITAVNEDDVFMNNGNSNVHVFTYGVPAPDPCDNPTFFAQMLYPTAGDTIPFKDMFYVMKFDPSCDNLVGVEANLTYNRMLNGATVGTITNNYNVNWQNGPGPKNFLLKNFERNFPGELDFYFPAGSEMETYLPMLDNNRNFAASRGESVSMSANVQLKTRIGNSRSTMQSSGQTINLPASNSKMTVVGMPRPVLNYPENDAVIEPGTVVFSFKTGEKPSNPLPPFKMFRIDGLKEPIVPNLNVMEKCVLQVATDKDFDAASIVFCQMKKIQNEPYNNAASFDEDNPDFEALSGAYDRTPGRKFDENHFTSNVYRDILISTDLNQNDTLYWRVVWLKEPENFNSTSPCLAGVEITESDIYHASEVRRLVLGEGEPVVTKEPDEELVNAECGAPCVFPALKSTTAGNLVQQGEIIKVAGFSMEVTQINNGTGKGLITVPFLNQAKLRVDFSGLLANADRQMISGTVTPEVASTTTLNSHLADFGKSISMTEYNAEDMEAAMEAGGRLLSLLQPGAEVSLPIGIDNEIGGNKIILGITSMTFKTDTAHLDLVANLKIPTLQELDGFISMGAQVCMTNEGLANDVRLYLPQDQMINMSSDNQFRINGMQGRSGELDMTYVEWDCSGFKALHLAGAMKFTRDWIVPADALGKVMDTGQVEARFGGRFTNLDDIIVRLEMDRFQLPDAEGWSFAPGNDIWIDLSNVQNPTNLNNSLPQDYVHPAFSSAGMENTWKGFYLKDLEVETPEFLNDDSGKRITFTMRDMLIDDSGVSFALNVENLLRWEQNGDMSGWKASLDTLGIHVVQSNIRDFGFKGKLGLPIADETQFMRYQGALVRPDDGDASFVISVKPTDELRIPISMASAVINRGTYVELVIGEQTYIEANLNATLAIGNSNLPSGESMASSLDLPGICIQNLKFNSETGFDESEFVYSLTTNCDDPTTLENNYIFGNGPNYTGWADALPEESDSSGSSEGTMSGFPITLEYLSFSNNRVTIQPRLTLTGGESGFSAMARVGILFDLDLLSKPQSITFTGVELDRIAIDIETVGVKIAGEVDFYKTGLDEGTRGKILMELDLGTSVGVSINADFGTRKNAGARKFNTPQWFSYFYVDGVGVFSEGIEIFTGFSLFGLGGGFYHHMKMLGNVPSGETVAGASSSTVPTGINYQPDFNTDFGLKFMVLCGSSDNGRAYNVDATLEAAFSLSHGLQQIDLTGTFRAATDGVSVATVGREGNSPLAGYVHLSLKTPAYQPATFDGQFFVKLKMPVQAPMLTGLGKLSEVPPGWTNQNAMVWATFYAGPDKWFFHMGTPDNRSGISLKIGGREMAQVTAYLMLGHDIPVVMPEPDAEFIRIFNKGMQSSSDFKGGDVSSLMGGNQRPPMPLGQGFATGLSLILNTGDVSYFPFYFNLKAVMGADINMTYAGPEAERRCAGSTVSPGVDGWYAMGQFYAGIEGNFGIKIDLFVEEIKVNILEASAAMIMQGGLPNPEWVQGRGSFYYNVCNGLAEGRCAFEISAGDICVPVTGNPFSDITLIQDITPESGATKVSVYTKASVAFSMNMGDMIEFQEFVSETRPPITRRIMPYMNEFKIVENGKTAGVAILEKDWSENNHIYTVLPEQRLAPNKKHTITVEARLRENGKDLKKSNGQVFKEVRTQVFTTGPEPDYIDDNNLAFTYPYINQQNFLKGETNFSQAFLRTRQGGNSSMMAKGEGYTTKFYVRFSTPGEESFTVPAKVMTSQFGFIFNVSQLKNDKIYCAQFIREDTPNQSSTTNSYISNLLGNQQSVSVEGGIKTLQIINLAKSIGESSVISNQYKKISLPSEQVGNNETQLYTYYFKTSKYDTMAQKMQAQANWRVEKDAWEFDTYRLTNDMDEQFEWTDVNSFDVIRGGKYFTPRVELKLQFPTQSGVQSGMPVTTVPVNAYLNYVIFPKLDQNPQNLKTMTGAIVNRLKNSGYATNEISNIDFNVNYPKFNSLVYIATETRNLIPLTNNAVVEAFNPMQYVTGSIKTTGVASAATSSQGGSLAAFGGLLSGGSAMGDNTKIDFRPTVSAAQQYTSFRQELINFTNSYGSKKVNKVIYLQSTYDVMTPSEKAAFLEHINRSTSLSRNRHINFRNINAIQHFGLQYVYPDALGNNVNGSLYRMQFTTTP